MSTIETLDHPRSTSAPTAPTAPSKMPATGVRRRGVRPTPTAPPGGAGGRRRHTALLVGLALLAVAGLVGTAVGFATRGDDRGPRDELAAIEGQLARVSAERDAAIADADILAGRVSILQGRVGALEAERDQLVDELASADADAAELGVRLGELDTQLADARSALTTATSDRDAAHAEVTRLESDLALARQQAAQAVAERDALANRFPITADPSIDVADVVGRYRVTWQEQFCTGVGTCGTVPTVPTATVRSTPEGYLRIELGDVVASNLSRVPGGLHAVAASTTALPTCGGVARPATVILTIFPDATTVARDGTVEIRTWGGAVTVQAAPAAGCPAALTIHGVTLAPAA